MVGTVAATTTSSTTSTQGVDCCIETESENLYIGEAHKVFGIDSDDLRNDSRKESIEFAGDDNNC